MLHVEKIQEFSDEISAIIDREFDKYALKHQVNCDYTAFNFVVKEGEKIVGILTGKSYFQEVHIGDLIVLEEYRGKRIGSELLKVVEEEYKDKGFEQMNLTTYQFQAPQFYEKCGFVLEYIRKSRTNPKLDKYFFVKYF